MPSTNWGVDRVGAVAGADQAGVLRAVAATGLLVSGGGRSCRDRGAGRSSSQRVGAVCCRTGGLLVEFRDGNRLAMTAYWRALARVEGGRHPSFWRTPAAPTSACMLVATSARRRSEADGLERLWCRHRTGCGRGVRTARARLVAAAVAREGLDGRVGGRRIRPSDRGGGVACVGRARAVGSVVAAGPVVAAVPVVSVSLYCRARPVAVGEASEAQDERRQGEWARYWHVPSRSALSPWVSEGCRRPPQCLWSAAGAIAGARRARVAVAALGRYS